MNKDEALGVLVHTEEEAKESINVINMKITRKVLKLQERIERFVTAIVPELENDTSELKSAHASLYQPFRDFELFVRSSGDELFKKISIYILFTKKSIESWSNIELPEEEIEKIISAAINNMEKSQNNIMKGWSDIIDNEFQEMKAGLEKLLHTFSISKEDTIRDIFKNYEN